MTEKSIGEKVVRGFRWLAVGRFAGQLVTWVVTIFVIRILSPEDYGLMAMATVVIGFLALFDEMGMGAAIIQRETIDEHLVSQVFGVVLLINLGAFLLLMIAAQFIAQFFDEPRLVAITWALSVQFPLLAFQVVPDAIIRRRMEFGGKSVVNFVSMVVGSLVTLGFALLDFAVWALVYGSIVTVVVRTIGYNVVARYFCWPSFNFAGLSRVVSFGGKVTLERVFWFIYSQADIFLVGRVLGKELLGFYSVAIHLASLPMSKLGAMMNEISFSGFSRIQSDPEEVSNQLKKATSVVGFFAFPVFFGISATAPEIVSVVLGTKWTLSTVPLQLLSLIIPLRMLDLVIPTALMATGRAGISVGNAAIAAVLLPASFAIGLKWGLVGVCYGWIIGYSIYFLVSMLRSLPALGVSLSGYLAEVLPVAASATSMMLAVYGMRALLPEGIAETWIALGVLVATGVVTFLGLAFAFHRDNIAFFLKLVKR